jgi:hypothetical protein
MLKQVLVMFFWAICLAGLPLIMAAQNLSFTQPAAIWQQVQSDNSPAIVNFNGHFFMAWKKAGSEGNIQYCNLGQQYTVANSNMLPENIPAATSNFSPALRVYNNRLYIFWINKQGDIEYTFTDGSNNFTSHAPVRLLVTNPAKLALGITAAPAGNQLLLATHAGNKDKLMYCLVQAGPTGELNSSTIKTFTNGRSKNYPFVINVNQQTSRICWRGYDDLIWYADYNTTTQTWGTATVKGNAQTKISPAVFHVWDTDKLFYIWQGNKNDALFYYKTVKGDEAHAGKTALPAYFSSPYPVSVCKIDDSNFLLAFTGNNQQLYLSHFSSYNPAHWMQQFLQPLTSTKKLSQVVFPGSHDAGMSVLTATGGQQKGTINECNTLTQQLNVGQQLNAGIRMFDLRAGTYQGKLHTKHCASDCMEDAIGGGYGESLKSMADSMRNFLQKNKQEFVLVSFSHFCEKETPMQVLKDSLLKWIGTALVFNASGYKTIGEVPISKLAGKVLLSFETATITDPFFPSCSIADTSAAFINFVRMYAATNDIDKLKQKQKDFFIAANQLALPNTLIRLDWQLTQSTTEAPFICNDFEDEKLNPVISGLMLLANKIQKSKSIINHSLIGNQHLPLSLLQWMADGTITKTNKPNILYVDVAGAWITDFCIDLLSHPLYQ